MLFLNFFTPDLEWLLCKPKRVNKKLEKLPKKIAPIEISALRWLWDLWKWDVRHKPKFCVYCTMKLYDYVGKSFKNHSIATVQWNFIAVKLVPLTRYEGIFEDI